MVKVGDFTVELVRADTKESFKEHTGPAQHVYAEVEPGVDYFIRAESSIGGVRARIKVDGADIGYWRNFRKPDSSKYIGNWERKDGISTTTAFHFNAAQMKREGSTSSMFTGKVEVYFYYFYELGGGTKVENARDHTAKTFSSDLTVGGKKCVVSTNGTHVLTKKVSKAKQKQYKTGKHLCTMTLNYCTAVGLIVNKILDAPPEPVSNVTSSSEVLKGVKLEKTKRENAKKRNMDEDPDHIIMLPDEKKPRESVETVDLTGESVETVTVDLTGDD